jgi:chromosome segregation ATPase
MTYTDRLDLIMRRTQWLLRQIAERDNALLKAREEAQRLKLQIDNQSLEIEELNNKIKIIKLARSFESGEDTATLKRKINEYIREIDNSIALLND